MKPKYIKVYQNVYFAKKMFSHFPSDRTIVADVDLKVVPGVGVQITNELDSIFVPYTNIAFCQLEMEEEEQEKEKKKPKSKAK